MCNLLRDSQHTQTPHKLRGMDTVLLVLFCQKLNSKPQLSETAAVLLGICSEFRRRTFEHPAKDSARLLLCYIETLLSIAGQSHLILCLGLAGEEPLETFRSGVHQWCTKLAAAKGVETKEALLVSHGMHLPARQYPDMFAAFSQNWIAVRAQRILLAML